MQVVTARAAIAGWTHVAVVYRDGAPSVNLDGKPAGQAVKSGSVVHPGLGESARRAHGLPGPDDRAAARRRGARRRPHPGTGGHRTACAGGASGIRTRGR